MSPNTGESCSPGEPHPQAPTDRHVTVSRHAAPVSLTFETSRFQTDTKKKSGSSPALAGLTITYRELTHPLRSNPITGPSSLIRDDPPLCPASVLSLSWGLHLSFSLAIRTTGSHVPCKSLNQIHATFMPDPTQAVNRYPLGLSWCRDSHQF